MLKIENDKYYRICDWCDDIREIKKGTYKSNLKKEIHLCVSCNQKRATEASRQKPVWNKGLSKATDERIKKYSETQSKNKKGKEPWNKGLTKETDIRVKNYSKSLSIVNKGKGTLKYFVNKYGNELGKIKYEELNKTKIVTLKSMINKYGELEGAKKYEHFLNSKRTPYSKVSQELFDRLYNYFNFKDHVYYAKLNKEFRKINNQKVYYYDFVNTKCKKVIEFNGDYFHANPNKFNEFDTPHPFDKTIVAKDIWEKDNEKINFIKSLGYEVLIIWESDYYKNKEDVIKKCIKFLEV